MYHEINISSCIIHAIPDHISSIVGKLSKEKHVEIAVIEQGHGKIVIVIETATSKQTSQIIEAISQLNGVLSVAMVYHHVEKKEEFSSPFINKKIKKIEKLTEIVEDAM